MDTYLPCILADDLSAQNSSEDISIAGINSILPKEHGNKFYNLQILHHLDKDVCAVSSWDSSIHNSQALNRVTEGIFINIVIKGFTINNYTFQATSVCI